MNYLIKTTSRARFSTWAAVKSWFFAAERCTLWQLATINFWPSIEFGWNSPKCYFSCKIEFWILCAKIQILPQCDSLLLLRVVWFSADTFQLLTKESKERKKKNLHEVEQRLGKLLPLHANFENHAQSSGEALTSLLYETYLASRLTYFSNLPAPKLLWV